MNANEIVASAKKKLINESMNFEFSVRFLLVRARIATGVKMGFCGKNCAIKHES